MIDLKQTNTGIYYLHDYIPTHLFRYYDEIQIARSKKIWDYKNEEDEALNAYTSELMEAVTEITADTSGDKVGLVAVPPSKVGKPSAVRTSIWNIERWYRKGITKEVFGCDKRIYDYKFLLNRSSDVSTSHSGRRATYEEHKQSITCSRDRLSKYWTTFILIDDVTTSGTIMDACRDILVEHGAVEKYIYRLAIARTILR